jgi:hypothetical protein
MTTVTYRKTSPYAITPQASWFLSNYVDRPVISDSSDTLVILDKIYEFRPDSLSFALYNTTDYWWVFMSLNPDIIQDPIYDMVAGIQIYVPTLDRLITLLGG